MLRLTRAQSQAQTRERLVVTARELFLRDGYHATSLERVAEAAGYSKGAVYSNFRNKDELCLAAIDAIYAAEVAAVDSALRGADTMEAQLTSIAGWADRVLGDQGLTTLLIEFGLQARRDPEIRAQLTERGSGMRAAISAAVAEQGHRFALSPRLSADDLATAALSLALGLGLMRALDPSMRVDILVNSLRALVT